MHAICCEAIIVPHFFPNIPRKGPGIEEHNTWIIGKIEV
jgi:hypothetical protein